MGSSAYPRPRVVYQRHQEDPIALQQYQYVPQAPIQEVPHGVSRGYHGGEEEHIVDYYVSLKTFNFIVQMLVVPPDNIIETIFSRKASMIL